MEIKKEKDISQRGWNTYLKKYAKTYKVILKEDRHNAIFCKEGDISRYSNTELVFYGEFNTERRKNSRIKMLPAFCSITQEGDTELCIKFPEEKLQDTEKVFKIRKKKQLTEEHRKALRDRMLELKKS